MKGILVVLTGPTSPDREEEYNEWYNKVHAVDVCALPGIHSISRYSVGDMLTPEGGTPSHPYLAIYDCDDMDLAAASLAEAVPSMYMSEALDLGGAIATFFQPIFQYHS